VTVDTADDDPTDFTLTVMCKPSGSFDLPLDANKKLPLCKAWLDTLTRSRHGLVVSACHRGDWSNGS
jgi:hypothetical protein